MNTDKEILSALHEGDAKAFEYVYNRLHTNIFLVALKYTRSEEEAKDIRSNCFMKLWELRDRLAFNNISELFTWLKVTAKNNCIDQIRKTSFRESKEHIVLNKYLQDHEEAAFEFTDKEAVILNRLLVRMENLPNKFKIVFKMRWLDDLLFREIAEKLGADISTIKKRYSRAVKLLRDCKFWFIFIGV